MDNQKCPSCSAPLKLVNNQDGTTSYHCNYCGYTHNNLPKTATDKVFAFAKRVANAFKDDNSDPFPGVSPEKKAELEQRLAAINEKKQAAYDKYMEKKIRAYEKHVNKMAKK